MTLKTVSIKGKEYVMVNERLKEFRAKYPNYSLISEIVGVDDNSCIIKAVIKNENGITVATGLAREEREDKTSLVNLNAYVENCETSAWGRALGNLGIGIDVAVASAEEMNTKISHTPQSFEEFKDAINKSVSVKQLSFLWSQYKNRYPEDTDEYKELNKLSSARKIQLQNPNLKVGQSN